MQRIEAVWVTKCARLKTSYCLLHLQFNDDLLPFSRLDIKRTRVKMTPYYPQDSLWLKLQLHLIKIKFANFYFFFIISQYKYLPSVKVTFSSFCELFLPIWNIILQIPSHGLKLVLSGWNKRTHNHTKNEMVENRT